MLLWCNTAPDWCNVLTLSNSRPIPLTDYLAMVIAGGRMAQTFKFPKEMGLVTVAQFLSQHSKRGCTGVI